MPNAPDIFATQGREHRIMHAQFPAYRSMLDYLREQVAIADQEWTMISKPEELCALKGRKLALNDMLHYCLVRLNSPDTNAPDDERATGIEPPVA